ncbi:MAG: hypothetical protein DRG40_05585 [Deltaproteobacteria bacterium]|nr:MAG: hypothetical protein DRG40_05585 [Deltaproteobacteria bacterium]
MRELLRINGKEGVTFLELMVVIAIVAILALLALPGLGQWKRKYDVETTIRDMYNALNEARMRAFSEKRVCGLWWSGSTVSQIELRCDSDADDSITDAGGFDRVWTKTLKIALNTSFTNNICTFSGKGFANIDNTSENFRYGATDVDAEYDCVVIGRTRIKMGEWDGTSCNPK